jgi:hypothetical protein
MTKRTGPNNSAVNYIKATKELTGRATSRIFNKPPFEECGTPRKPPSRKRPGMKIK